MLNVLTAAGEELLVGLLAALVLASTLVILDWRDTELATGLAASAVPVRIAAVLGDVVLSSTLTAMIGCLVTPADEDVVMVLFVCTLGVEIVTCPLTLLLARSPCVDTDAEELDKFNML